MNEDLISIIVPIYNIQNYIEKCVSSIIKQTYYNLEILLVNDGSTDDSLEICEKFKDNRIKILNKMNGGLSDARNYGLHYSKGNYVIFIDGDDFIDEKMIETLYENLIASKSDISVCSFKYYYNSNKIKDYYEHNENDDLEILNSEQAIKLILDGKKAFKQCAWNKLYKRSLFDDIEYPLGKLYEDMGTTYKLLMKSNRIVYTSKSLYFYVQRDNSITKTFKFNEREFDRIEMANCFTNDIVKYFPSLKYDALKFKVMQYIAVSNIMIRAGKKDENLIRETKKTIKKDICGVLKKSNKKEKAQIILYLISFEIYSKVFKKRIM